jgi:predicted transcriptional regulator
MLVFSVAPVWAEAIRSGEKTIELRRRPPALSAATDTLVYVTSPVRQLQLICRFGPLSTMPKDALWSNFGAQSCVPRQMFDSYFSGMAHANAIYISHVEELPRKLTLEYLRQAIGVRPPRSWLRATGELVELIRMLKC